MSTKHFVVPAFRAAAASLLAIALIACGQPAPEKVLASARGYLSKGDRAAAIIELKSLLQSSPDNGEARLLLGQSHLESRDVASAEKELRRALELRQPIEKVLPLYARALLLEGKHDAVISEVEKHELFDPAAVAATRTTLGDAYAAKGDAQRAIVAYQAALIAVPSYGRARLGQAVMAAREGRLDDALKQAEQIIAADPKLAESYGLKSDLLLVKGEREEAKRSLRKALEVDDNFLPAHFSLISVLIDEGAFDQVAAQIASVRKVAPRDLRVTYFDGLLAYRKGDAQNARNLALQVLKSAPAHVPSLVLAGAAELKLNQFVSAESYLRRALAHAPGHAAARRSLVSTQLRMGMPVQAMETLKPLLAHGMPQDFELSMLAGETFLANGDLKKAAAYYKGASIKDDTWQATAKTRLGQIALATGNAEEGFRELEAASEINAGAYQADLSMVNGHLRRREFDKAMTAAKALEKKQPKNPITFQVYGLVHLAMRNLAEARKSFEKAIELQPNYLPAAVNLGLLDVAERRPEIARRRYEAMIAKYPKDARLHLALADLQVRVGDPTHEIAATLRRAVEGNPQSIPARLALISFYVNNKDARAALSAAQSADAALPNQASIIEALGVAQEHVGETNQAIETYNRLAALSPKSTEPLFRLAALHVRQKETEKAIAALRRAEKLLPSNRNLVPRLVQVYLAADRVEDALKETRDLQRRNPKFAGAFALEGDILVSQKRWLEAEKAYRDALRLEPKVSPVAIALHNVLIASKRTADAETFSKKWIADHPKDVVMRLYLAERDLREKNFKSAAANYRAVLAQVPDNVAVLNNFSWALRELGDPKAIEFAEKALKFGPNNPAALDTIGVLLVETADAKKGVEYLEQATKLAPNVPTIRLHYAKGLIKLGKKDAARKELEVLRVSKEDFDGKAGIEELLKSL